MDAQSMINSSPGLLSPDLSGQESGTGPDQPCPTVKSLSPSPLVMEDNSQPPAPCHKKRTIAFVQVKATIGAVGKEVPKTPLTAEDLFQQIAPDQTPLPPETLTTFFSHSLTRYESPSNLLILYFWGKNQGIMDENLARCKEKIARLLVSDLLTRLYPMLPAMGSKRFKDGLSVALYCRKRTKEGRAAGSDIDQFLREKLGQVASWSNYQETENDFNCCHIYLKVFGENPAVFITELINNYLPVEILFEQVVNDAKGLRELAQSEPQASPVKPK